MQYTHHDFYSNFTASLKSGDLDITTDILANEISDFIVFDTGKIIEAINKSDIKADTKNTDEEIVDLIIKNISDNQKLSKALGFIISDGNELINNTANTAPADKNKQLQIVTNVANGISKIGKDIQTDSKKFKDSVMNQIVSKAAKVKEYKRIIWNKDKNRISGGVWLLVGLGVVAITVGLIYRRQKNSVSKAIPQMISGGTITPPITNNIPNPTPVQTSLLPNNNNNMPPVENINNATPPPVVPEPLINHIV